MTGAGDADPRGVKRDPNRPTLHPAFVQRALDAEAEAWATETDIVDGWLARMSTDPRTVAKLRQIAVLAFTEGLYRGACNVFDGTPLSVTVEGVAIGRDRLTAELAAARAAAATARADALEEAAAWHEVQVQSGHCGEENAEAAARRRANRHHEASAAAIRAARTTTGSPAAPTPLNASGAPVNAPRPAADAGAIADREGGDV